MTTDTDFETKITSLSDRITDLGRTVADLTSKRSALAPQAVDDKKARAEFEQLEVARTNAEKETGLIRSAIDQLKKLAAQAKDAAAAREQQKRVDAAAKLGQQILALDEQIDTALAHCGEWFEQRRALASELNKFHVYDPQLIMRLHQRYGATHAAAYHGLRNFIGIEHVEPHHHRALAASDAWLRDLGASKQQGKPNGKETEVQRKGAPNGS